MSEEEIRTNKKTIYISNKLYNNLDSYYTAVHDKQASLSSKISESITDLIQLIEVTRRYEMVDLFSIDECLYLIDMRNGYLRSTDINLVRSLEISAYDSNEYEDLSSKWKVDMDIFLKKLRNLTQFQAYVIEMACSEFWTKYSGTMDYNKVAELFNCKTYCDVVDIVDTEINKALLEEGNKKDTVTVRIYIERKVEEVKAIIPTIKKYQGECYKIDVAEDYFEVTYYVKD